MQRFTFRFTLHAILGGLLMLVPVAAGLAVGDEAVWQAIPAAPQRTDDSSSAPRRTITTRPAVYDTSGHFRQSGSVTWGNAAEGHSAASPIRLVSGDVHDRSGVPSQTWAQPNSLAPPTPTGDPDPLAAFNSGDVQPIAAVQIVAAQPPFSVQQPPLRHLGIEYDAAPPSYSLPEHRVSEPAPRLPNATRSADTPATAPPLDLPTIKIETLEIDLTQNPKYADFLPNTMPCGVVLIQADFPLNEMTSVAREIAMLQEDLLLYLAVPAPREKIDLCLFASSKSYIAFLQAVFPNAPLDRPALFIKRPGEPATLLVQRDANFEIDLRHEMTHAILHARIDNVPMWLDEGLAKYLEWPREYRPYHSPYLKTVKWQSNLWMTSSLSRLESLKFVDEMGTREYRDSWAWVHFLIHHSPETHQFLASHLQRLATASENPARRKMIEPIALSRSLTSVVESPRSSMRAHFGRWPMPTAPPTASPATLPTDSSEGSLTAFFTQDKKSRPPASSAVPSSAVPSSSALPAPEKKWYQIW